MPPPETKRVTWLLTGGAALGATLAILYFYAPTEYAFYPRCFLHSMTGLSCPGCGCLRAVHQLLHGEVAAAFRLNPLFLLSLPIAACAALAQMLGFRTNRMLFARFQRPAWIWSVFGIILAFGILRNVPIRLLFPS